MDSDLPYNTDEPFEPTIVRPNVPPDIEAILREIEKVALDVRDVTDDNIGLRVQWQAGLIEKDELQRILDEKRTLRQLIDQGKFVP